MRRSYLGLLAGFFASAFLAVFLLYPLAVILLRSFSSLNDVLTTLGNPFYRQRLLFSTYLALLSTALTVLLALPSALMFARYDFRGKRLLRAAFTIPFVMPTVVVAIGFLALVGPRGLLPMNLSGTLLIILAAHVFYNYAVVVRIVGAFLEASGSRLREAARMLGASPWRVLWRVTLPLALPSVLAAAALVFIFCFTSFGVIVILAPEPRFATLEVEIYRLTTRFLELNGAAVLALAQLIVVGVFTWLYTRLQAKLAVPLSGAQPLPRPTGRTRWLLGANFLLAAALLLAPLFALVFAAFRPEGHFSLANFSHLEEVPASFGFIGAPQAIFNSLRFSLAAMVVSLVVGLAFAYAVARGGWRWLDGLSLLPLATSAVTLGFGYLLAFPNLVVSPWGLILAYSLIGFPFVARSLLPALRGLPTNLTQAATTLGANPLSVLRRIELPLLTPSLVAAAGFAFAVAIGEFGATLVLARPAYATIPRAIFDRLSRPGVANYGEALALSVLLMALTGAAMLLLERFGQSEI